MTIIQALLIYGFCLLVALCPPYEICKGVDIHPIKRVPVKITSYY
jgi:hypothetical protein